MPVHEQPDQSNGGQRLPDTFSFISSHEVSFAIEPVEARIGRVSVGYTTWGKPRDVSKHGTGFTVGHFYPPDYDIFSQAAQDTHVAQATAMLRPALKKARWDGVDTLIVASTTSASDIADRVADELRAEGITINSSQHYNYACHGAIGAAMEQAAQTEYKGKRVAITAVESVSGNVVDYSDTPGAELTRDTFGNGGGWFLFTVGDDITFIEGETHVIKDTEGVITVPFQNPLPPESERLPPLDSFIFKSGSEHIYARSAKHAYLQLPASPDGFVHMLRKTLQLFVRYGAPIIYEGDKKYRTLYQAQYGPLGEPVIHQPSSPVIGGLARVVRELKLLDRQLDPPFVRLLSKLTPEALQMRLSNIGIDDFNDPYYPWIMDQTIVNNIVSATSLVQLTEMIKQGRIRPGIATPVYGLAIGLMVGRYYMEFNRS